MGCQDCLETQDHAASLANLAAMALRARLAFQAGAVRMAKTASKDRKASPAQWAS